MKRGFALLLLSLTPAWCQVAKPATVIASTNLPPSKAARIPSQTIGELERTFNSRLVALAPDANEGLDLLGDTRGVQLEDYGVVFTTEVSLVVTPGITPFRQKIPPELAARVHKIRVDRMPLLKTAMKEMMRSMATAFTQIPASHQLVLVVRLYYGAWEDTTGMPAQVIMRADRASAAAGKVETEER
jgi:hypothetical protein